jgi:hypothetical protein
LDFHLLHFRLMSLYSISKIARTLPKKRGPLPPPAQFDLAFMYETGEGVAKGYTEALNWQLPALPLDLAFKRHTAWTLNDSGEC